MLHVLRLLQFSYYDPRTTILQFDYHDLRDTPLHYTSWSRKYVAHNNFNPIPMNPVLLMCPVPMNLQTLFIPLYPRYIIVQIYTVSHQSLLVIFHPFNKSSTNTMIMPHTSCSIAIIFTITLFFNYIQMIYALITS